MRLLFAIFILVGGLNVAAQESGEENYLGRIQVFGSEREALNRPTLPSRVSKKKQETYQFTDVNRALKHTSGVYVREEDGQGLRPNIGLRGTNPDRSKKVVIMEDGVLAGPAPYSAPAAYYTPTMYDSDSLEIFQGFSAMPYGPNSIGGAINYLTPDIPQKAMVETQASAGSFETLNMKVKTGAPTGFGGYLLLASREQSGGFKKIDGGGDTGYEKNNFYGKLRFGDFQLSAGYTTEDSHETYLGLSQTDFDESPFRRYSSTQLDEMKWQQFRLQLRHTAQVNESTVVETALYRNRFHRDWYRLDRFRDGNKKLRSILRDPASDPHYYDVVTGQADTLASNDQLLIANNDRTFLSQGLQTRLISEFGESVKHSLELLARYHTDSIRRDHTSDNYNMLGGKMVRAADDRQQTTLNKDEARAITLSLQDNITFGAFTLTPAVRTEWIDFSARDDLAGTALDRQDQYWVPGLSWLFRATENLSIRYSVNRATTAPGVSSSGVEKREDATNYEFETKYADPERNIEAEVTAFYNDYKNITGTCSLSSGCTSNDSDLQFNGGKAMIRGLEARAAKGLQAGKWYFPIQGNVTLLEAVFKSDFTTTSEEWGGNVRSGDPLPYVPRVRYTFSVGTEFKRFAQDLSIVYQGKVYDQSAEAGRVEIPGYGILDWAGSYRFSARGRLTAKVDNILAREYAVSARPYGLRPGKPQTFMAGLVYQF